MLYNENSKSSKEELIKAVWKKHTQIKKGGFTLAPGDKCNEFK